MTHEENNVFSETAKMVIFIHPAVHFIIDQSITENAAYIKLANPEWSESGESILYYLNEMRNTANSDKKYIIMEYEPIIGETIKALMEVPGKYHFCDWSFYTFFHTDTTPQGEEPNPMYNTNDEKLEILSQFFNYSFILLNIIPPGHTLTATDLQSIKNYFSYVPETAEEFEATLKTPRKPHFPFYEPDLIKLKAYLNKSK